MGIAGALLASPGPSTAIAADGPGPRVPADKRLPRDWLDALVQRGTPDVYRGDELQTIGLPIGGIGTGQLYLGGDGRLWHWDIFNLPQSPDFANTSGPHYARPARPTAPLEQGFAVRVTDARGGQTRVLDRRGMAAEHIAFRGEYPIGRVAYRDPSLGVEIDLEAFSPFIPLHADDSSFPATLFEFTLHNPGTAMLEVELLGWLENAVCLATAQETPVVRRNRITRGTGVTMLECSASEPAAAGEGTGRPDMLIDDFERAGYGGWQATGTAFGAGPVRRQDIPAYQGDVGGAGQRVVNSHASAPGNDVGAKDRATGRLVSPAFRLERHYVQLHVGGGDHPGRTCVNLKVADQVVRSATGAKDNRMRLVTWDVRELAGQMAVLEIVDAESGAWGNVGVDQIVQSDRPAPAVRLADQPDFGTLALALLDDAEEVRTAVDLPLDAVPAHLLLSTGNRRPAKPTATAPPATKPPATPRADQEQAEAPPGRRIAGAVGRTWQLAPGARVRATFVLAWHFPALPRGRFEQLEGAAGLRRWYATRFTSAGDVVEQLRRDYERLVASTRLWNRTWYDSSLPYWLLDRALQPLCCIATATCYRFSNGRFYGYEGTYCCEGTCSHVWHYAQALARVFPELERDVRERVDLGLAFHNDTGAIDYRGEHGRREAVDGQAGTVLRIYREHQMSPNRDWLTRLWPRVRRSIEFLLARDRQGDGILDGEQYNTLDASWFGEIAWLSSLYLAAVRAGAAMAVEVGDEAFAQRCNALAERGGKALVERLYNGEYFIQRLDPQHAGAVNTNDGCHIDQVLGQSWAFQVGLPRVLPSEPTRSALRALWKYNFAPDVGPYRRQMTEIPGGRWYALPGEGGLLMCTWPRGGAAQARGDGSSPFVGYFNECMTGFEYQVAAHMLWEGLVEEGLAVTRAIHERYHAARRNPWNDVECSDHYARAMASLGIYLAACGYEYHGPRGYLGLAPRVHPEAFRAALLLAEGWGTFAQSRRPGALEAQIALAFGQLRLQSLALELDAAWDPQVQVTLAGQILPEAPRVTRTGQRVLLEWPREFSIATGETLIVQLTRP
ncbi:MAG: GH116 family glycosyl-hydrolase [Pirellulales bacterium]